MSINWFPGHMHKARKEIAQVMPQVDIIIEMLDARIPFSSENPLVPELRGDTPVIKVLNKADLADPAVTALWVERFEQEKGIKAIPISQQNPEQIKALLQLCNQMLPERNLDIRGARAMIMGIPNVGKSTIINLLNRFYELQSGTISIDGKDIKTFELKSLRNQIAVVLQDVFLFSGSDTF